MSTCRRKGLQALPTSTVYTDTIIEQDREITDLLKFIYITCAHSIPVHKHRILFIPIDYQH